MCQRRHLPTTIPVSHSAIRHFYGEYVCFASIFIKRDDGERIDGFMLHWIIIIATVITCSTEHLNFALLHTFRHNFLMHSSVWWCLVCWVLLRFFVLSFFFMSLHSAACAAIVFVVSEYLHCLCLW